MKWWIAEVDVAQINGSLSSGGGQARVILTTEELFEMNAQAYCNIRRGPFDSRDEVDGCCLVGPDFETTRLGKDARSIVIPRFILNALLNEGYVEPIPLSSQIDKWWVCGMSGGVCQTDALLSMHEYGRHISHGPFLKKEDAEYVFDLLWES